MEKRKDIDMLRFYGGDIHQKNKEGEYVITNNLVNPKNKEDEMTFAYYDLVMDEGIFIEEQTYVMLMNFFAHCEKILRINLNPENWKDMKWDEIIDNQINEENKITCHLRNKIRSC